MNNGMEQRHRMAELHSVSISVQASPDRLVWWIEDAWAAWRMDYRFFQDEPGNVSTSIGVVKGPGSTGPYHPNSNLIAGYDIEALADDACIVTAELHDFAQESIDTYEHILEELVSLLGLNQFQKERLHWLMGHSPDIVPSDCGQDWFPKKPETIERWRDAAQAILHAADKRRDDYANLVRDDVRISNADMVDVVRDNLGWEVTVRTITSIKRAVREGLLPVD